MASQNDFVVGICIFSLCIMLLSVSSDAAAAQDDALAIQRRELGESGQLAKSIYKVWNKGKEAFDLVEMTMEQAENFVDKLCDQNPINRCCAATNLPLNCTECCNAPRPGAFSLLPPSPSPPLPPMPMPMPTSSAKGFLPPSSWNQPFLLLLAFAYDMYM